MDKQAPNPHDPIALEPVDMHGPVEVSIKVYMKLPDGKAGSLTLTAAPGQLPTRAEQIAMLDAVLDADKRAQSALPEGVSPLTKPEFVRHITRRETGLALDIPGDQHFVPAACEIPHDMLVNAIAGAGFPTMELADEFTKRGMAKFTGNQWNEKWEWDKSAIAALPDAMLLAIYQRVAA
jgi:hypothetical protein